MMCRKLLGWTGLKLNPTFRLELGGNKAGAFRKQGSKTAIYICGLVLNVRMRYICNDKIYIAEKCC